MNNKSLLSLACLVLLSMFTLAAGQTKFLNNRQYQLIDGQWYQVEDEKQYLVNQSVITFKFRDDTPQSRITDFISSHGLVVLRVNILGFHDIRIPDGLDALTLVEEYLNVI